LEKPVLGVMLTGSSRNGVPLMHPNMHILAQEGEAGIVFFFAPQIDFETMTVEGYTFTNEEGWQTRIHDVPNVIFHNAISSHQPSLESIRKLRKMDWYLFNQMIGNKWRMTNLMNRWAPLSAHVPDTDYLSEPKEVDDWLSRYPAVYLKPITGCGGTGIMRVEYNEDGLYKISGELEAVMTQEEFYPFIMECRSHTHYIIQREIKLFSVDDRKIDLRVFVVRDGDKKWRAISTVAKWGADDKIVTNLVAGGEMKSLDWLAEETKKQGVPMPTQEEIERVATEAGESIMSRYPKVTYLGMDVALDYNGDLYLLDLNPAPTRKTLDEEQKRTWYRHMMAFAKTVDEEIRNSATE